MKAMRDESARAFEELSIFLAKGVQLFALGIEHSKDALVLVRHRNNDFGARSMERGQISWIVVDVADHDRFPGFQRRAAQPLRDWETGIRRRLVACVGENHG